METVVHRGTVLGLMDPRFVDRGRMYLGVEAWVDDLHHPARSVLRRVVKDCMDDCSKSPDGLEG